ncbi:response regulator [Mucilaginibacter sp. dw_454]|uniref:HAMP domain-containing hybrid sensor histidine kinase/response regulator n=1 Tax=Mucilaginibacter sp. dw_454 TaxID=2720079 RepID=UPI001BD5ED5E|nr:response regulator [Mucilaginibacter sp. dw_454]
MAFLIVMELFTLGFAIQTLSSVRSFVGGEGLWSKAQKDAVASLRLYAYSRNEKDYIAFQQFLKVPLGDGKARKALEKKDPDLEMARQGFIEGRIHPDDIDGMIKLMLRFNQNKYIAHTIFYWEKAEAAMLRLIPVSEQLHKDIVSGNISRSETNQVLSYIEKINAQLTPLEDNFSYTLGEGSRWFEQLILRILIGLALTVEITGILIAISISRGIEKGLKEIIKGAEMVSNELFNTRVKVYSRDEIGILAVAFNKMTDRLEQTIAELKESEVRTIRQKERAEESEKIKQLFITNMSHEIRTPMSAIIGFAYLLEHSNLNNEQTEYIDAILKSSEFLQILLNNILDFSRLEAGKVFLEHKSISLYEAVHTAISMSRIDAAKKSLIINFVVDEKIPKVVYGDEMRLYQILINLVSNAIKYTFIGFVFVEVLYMDETDEHIWVEFSVQDTGIGVPAEKQRTIFESFEQVNKNKSFGGIGLGLSIAKRLTELQGGRIGLRSSSPGGSDFTVLLPFNKKPTVSGGVNNRPDTLKSALIDDNKIGTRVLVADDNELNRLLMSRILEQRGFYVDMVTDGYGVLERLKLAKYDIILMDLDMPELDGYETTTAIRDWKNDKRNTPIIAVTAHVSTEERDKCFRNGMDGFIAKPFSPDELYENILKLLNERVINPQI